MAQSSGFSQILFLKLETEDGANAYFDSYLLQDEFAHRERAKMCSTNTQYRDYFEREHRFPASVELTPVRRRPTSAARAVVIVA